MQWKEGFNMAEMITVKIDGTDVTVPKGTTILEAARKIGVKIPTLCNHPDLRPSTGQNSMHSGKSLDFRSPNQILAEYF